MRCGTMCRKPRTLWLQWGMFCTSPRQSERVPPLPSLLAPAKRRTIVGEYAPAARIGAEEGLGHRGGARIYSP